MSTTQSRELATLESKVERLRAAAFAVDAPDDDRALIQELIAAEKQLEQLEHQLIAVTKEELKEQEKEEEHQARALGADTTGLKVATTINFDPLPTGVYNLMNPATHTLLNVRVDNVSRDIRRILVTAYIEGISATAASTVEIRPRGHADVKLHPTLLPEQMKNITVMQRATLHVIVEDLDGKVESHNTYVITLLSRTTSYMSLLDERSGQRIDLTMYYGAWVTPNIEPVRKLVRRATDFMQTDDFFSNSMTGYAVDKEELVREQVKALYQAVKDAGIAYVNSGTRSEARTSKLNAHYTRLPRETLSQLSANCIDATVLFASLLEAISINAAIVLIPGHSLVAWENKENSNDWEVLETTATGKVDFKAALGRGKQLYQPYQSSVSDKVKLMPLPTLRAQGVWPME